MATSKRKYTKNVQFLYICCQKVFSPESHSSLMFQVQEEAYAAIYRGECLAGKIVSLPKSCFELNTPNSHANCAISSPERGEPVQKKYLTRQTKTKARKTIRITHNSGKNSNIDTMNIFCRNVMQNFNFFLCIENIMECSASVLFGPCMRAQCINLIKIFKREILNP